MKHNIETVRVLRRYRDAREKYQTSQRELEEIETMINGLSVDYSKQKVQTSPEADKLADMVDRLHSLREKCFRTGEKAVKEMEQTKELIDKVDNALLHDVLSRRYISCQKWETIAVAKGYSWEGIHKLHRQAVEEVEKIRRCDE